MESSTIMGDSSPGQARFTEKVTAVMIETAPAHLLRLARRVRLLPKDPPPHAVALAVITAAVLGAATGVVLAVAAPAPEPRRALAPAVATTSFPSAPRELVHPNLPAVRRPDAPATGARALAGPTGEMAPARPATAPFPLAATPSPPLPSRIVTASTPAPRGARTPAARNPQVQANVATNSVSRRGAVQGAAAPLAAAAASGVARPPLAPPALRGEETGDDSSGAEELIWLAERAFQSGHPTEAVRLGKKALAAQGGARAHLALAAAYFDLRQFDDARASYEAVLQTDPGNQAARIGLDLAKTAQQTAAQSRAPEPQP